MAERSVQRAASSAAQQAGMSFGRLHTRALKKRPSSEATVWPSRSAGCAASCTSGFTACVPVLLSGQRLLFFSLLHLTRSNRYLTTKIDTSQLPVFSTLYSSYKNNIRSDSISEKLRKAKRVFRKEAKYRKRSNTYTQHASAWRPRARGGGRDGGCCGMRHERPRRFRQSRPPHLL